MGSNKAINGTTLGKKTRFFIFCNVKVSLECHGGGGIKFRTQKQTVCRN